MLICKLKVRLKLQVFSTTYSSLKRVHILLSKSSPEMITKSAAKNASLLENGPNAKSDFVGC